MAFFKKTRDHLKANAWISHLQFAGQFANPKDMIRCEHHIRGAQKALLAFRHAHAEYAVSDEGWQYLATLAEPLQVALEVAGFERPARDLKEIVNYIHRMMDERGISNIPLENPFPPSDPKT